MPDAFDRFLLVTLLLLGARVLPAAEPSSVYSAPVAADQLKALNDQTIIRSSVWLDTEWDQFKHGAEGATWTLGGLWGSRVSDRQDWAVRLKVPFVYDRSGEASGHTDIGGLGDIEVATGTAFRLNNAWRTGGGIELHTDTASDHTLAEKVWRLKAGWGVAHDFTKWLSASFNADYNQSIAERGDVRPHRDLEMSLPVTLIFPQAWSINAKYKTDVDFQNGDRWTHTVGVGVAKRLPNVPIVLSATLEKQFDGGNKMFQANLTMTYYFERYHVAK